GGCLRGVRVGPARPDPAGAGRPVARGRRADERGDVRVSARRDHARPANDQRQGRADRREGGGQRQDLADHHHQPVHRGRGNRRANRCHLDGSGIRHRGPHRDAHHHEAGSLTTRNPDGHKQFHGETRRSGRLPSTPTFTGELMARHIFTRPAVAGLLVALGLALAYSHAGPGAGDPVKEPDRTADQAAVKARTRTLLEVLGKGNAKELAAFWTPTGEYHREELNLRGRANIEKAYAEALKTKSPRALVVQGDAVRFLSDDAAIHEGTFLDKRANPADQHRSRFSILYLRGKGQWQIGLLRETPLGPSPQELGWLVGAWTCQT